MTTINTDSIIVPSSPADRKAIMDAIVEISGALTRIEGEKNFIKEAIADLSEKFEISKKPLTKLARTYHKSSYSKDISEVENFQQLYESVTGQTSL